MPWKTADAERQEVLLATMVEDGSSRMSGLWAPVGIGAVDAGLAVAAVLGALALLVRLAIAVLRLGVRAAESTAAEGLAEVSERRGDVTGFLERRESASALRRGRRRAALAALVWALLLVVPPFAGMAHEVYAAAALLWLLPRPPLRRPAPGGG